MPDRRSPARRLRPVLLLAPLVVLPLLLDSFSLYQATMILIYVTAIIGLDIVFGRAGVLSVAQAVFIGIGAYTAAWMSRTTTVSIGVELIAAAVIAGLAAILVGLPALRVSGLRLAILTFAFVELFQWVVTTFASITGGTQGLLVNPGGFGTVTTADPLVGYGLAAVIALLATWLVIRLQRNPIGRSMAAVKNSNLLAESAGVSTVRTKLTAFMLSGMLGGLAGVVLAHVSGSVTPAGFTVFSSLNLLVALILGGTGRVHGAWLGAAYVVLMPELFARLGIPNAYPIVNGAVLMLLLVVMPGGIAGVLDGIRDRVRRSGAAPPPPLTPVPERSSS
ncbi:branched-chain amino acid ABC transporter permease [Nonomuraea cavernae]|uniref:Branched-chain amino acid ABC transporter permease n=1 Tax=Nonomuraea cavernae TaxID=2045107 RepID=A0A917ZAV0_9ACTN|nr:branched-chain amino acid ABC transporter permease [Nonomuraea cavernae]MCA2190418.1 branched-chain amino acid ABC transporter permease [Nonomuraea cavernae]GGO79699.1 branched-chain amino acid ABC transporter permease [Nonomuraea cavernae]